MKLTSHSFNDGDTIPAEFAFAVPDAATHIALSANRNPHLAWSDAPEGTASFVVICHDPDAPTSAEDVNVEGRLVPADLPRANFYHWLLFDIPAHINKIEAGSHSDGVTPTGKSGPAAPGDLRHGLNSYTDWFAGDPDMRGNYFGYDGPCPPWNDSLIHHYIFTVYALSTPQLTVSEPYDGTAVEAALAAATAAGQVLASASLTTSYALNPALRK
jgi:Raf kinase inhibitor-like YbhB/YbcL family protein